MALAYPVWSWRRFNSLNRFLNDEIYRLSNEPGLHSLIPSNDTVKQWAQQLVLMLKPDAWSFKPGSPTLNPEDMPTLMNRGVSVYCPLPGLEQLELEFEAHHYVRTWTESAHS